MGFLDMFDNTNIMMSLIGGGGPSPAAANMEPNPVTGGYMPVQGAQPQTSMNGGMGMGPTTGQPPNVPAPGQAGASMGSSNPTLPLAGDPTAPALGAGLPPPGAPGTVVRGIDPNTGNPANINPLEASNATPPPVGGPTIPPGPGIGIVGGGPSGGPLASTIPPGPTGPAPATSQPLPIGPGPGGTQLGSMPASGAPAVPAKTPFNYQAFMAGLGQGLSTIPGNTGLGAFARGMGGALEGGTKEAKEQWQQDFAAKKEMFDEGIKKLNAENNDLRARAYAGWKNKQQEMIAWRTMQQNSKQAWQLTETGRQHLAETEANQEIENLRKSIWERTQNKPPNQSDAAWAAFDKQSEAIRQQRYIAHGLDPKTVKDIPDGSHEKPMEPKGPQAQDVIQGMPAGTHYIQPWDIEVPQPDGSKKKIPKGTIMIRHGDNWNNENPEQNSLQMGAAQPSYEDMQEAQPTVAAEPG